MYKCPVTVLIFPVWIKDDTSVFSYGVTAFAQLKALHSATQGLFGKVNKKPPPHSTCSFQC